MIKSFEEVPLRSNLVGKVGLFADLDEVLNDDELTRAEKREVLAAWASDAHAVENAPGLRQLESGAVVSVDAVLAALRLLDADSPGARPASPHRTERHNRRMTADLARWRTVLTRRSRRDHDDDPPPCPAAALPWGPELARRRKFEAPEPMLAAA